MKKPKSLYHGHRFPAGIISCAVRWYFRFQLSLRDIVELLFERGVVVTYETSRCWCDKFGRGFAIAPKQRDVSRVVHGISTKCSSRFVENRIFYGGRLTELRIPGQSERRFQSKPNAVSMAKRTLIP
jgi:hypothetical protein